MMNSPNHSAASPSPSTSPPPPPPPPAPTIVIYPTVSPQTVIIPIISSIVVFPAAALTVICCLRYRAKRARRRAKQPRLGDKTERAVPVIRIDGSRKPESGMKGGKSKKRDPRHTNELHFTSATVFQAVLGIDLDLDERSEWENEVMGYTSVRGMTSPTSSVGSLQACPPPNSAQPRIIQMEMSPRAARSTRSSPGRCDPPPGHLTSPPSDTGHTDIWRRPGELPQRNGRPPGPLTELQFKLPENGTDPEPVSRKSNGHGPPEPHLRLAEDGPTELHVQRTEDSPLAQTLRRPAEPNSPDRRRTSEDGDQEQEEYDEPVDFWREPLRFIDDSSEAS